jgi:hypothetical protein
VEALVFRLVYRASLETHNRRSSHCHQALLLWVGGGSDAFREAVHAAADQEQQNEHGVDPIPVQVKVETVCVHDNGTGNIREILSVQVLPPANY